jgi:hypothetical protein
MKSQLMTVVSIVGVLGTATTAMAVNTDALSALDPGAIGAATDTLLPDPTPTLLSPTATPAPSDPVITPVVPTVPEVGGSSSGNRTTDGNDSADIAVAPATVPDPVPAPAVQNPQAPVVDGSTGGSGGRNSEDNDHEEYEGEDDD